MLSDGRIRAFGLTFEGFLAAAEAASLPSRGLSGAIYRNLFHQGTISCAELSPKAAASWDETFEPGFLEVETVFDEEGEYGPTRKARFVCADGSAVETVLIPMAARPGEPPRNTLCVSSQIGCAMGCAFCRTGASGLSRGLETWEIVSQASTARIRLGWDFGNIVFMGMGEALDNFDEVAHAIAVFMDRRGFSLSAERITVCTAGLPAGIERLRELGFRRLGLSVSLNSGIASTRARLMPGASRLADPAALAKAAASYPQRDNFVLGVNVCLIPGVNDSDEEIRAIADFCARAGRCLVNVIPYNPGGPLVADAPTAEQVDDFMRRLARAGLDARTRAGKGTSIMGACGQLAGRTGA